jgi:hypothetical protein
VRTCAAAFTRRLLYSRGTPGIVSRSRPRQGASSSASLRPASRSARLSQDETLTPARVRLESSQAPNQTLDANPTPGKVAGVSACMAFDILPRMKIARVSFLLPLLGLSFWINLVLIAQSWGMASETLKTLAGPLATLIAGIVGLSAIAWQAKLGFDNLRAGQEHRAIIEAAAREDVFQRDLRKKEIEDNKDRVSIMRAIRAEIATNIVDINFNLYKLKAFLELDKVDQVEKATWLFAIPKITISRELYLSVIGRIGQLEDLCSDVVRCYQLLVVLENNIVDMEKIQSLDFFKNVSKRTAERIEKNLDRVAVYCKDIDDYLVVFDPNDFNGT